MACLLFVGCSGSGISRVQVAAEGPSLGPENAPVTIVEFSDFQCPYCAAAVPTLDQVMSAYPDKVRLVYRSFPLPQHANAYKAAEAGLCADEQGQFWPMHDWMFAHQSQLALTDLKQEAMALGLDSAQFDSCLDSGKYAARVEADLKAGEAAGVSATPTFFINGRELLGAQPFEAFKQIIDEELQAGQR